MLIITLGVIACHQTDFEYPQLLVALSKKSDFYDKYHDF